MSNKIGRRTHQLECDVRSDTWVAVKYHNDCKIFESTYHAVKNGTHEIWRCVHIRVSEAVRALGRV